MLSHTVLAAALAALAGPALGCDQYSWDEVASAYDACIQKAQLQVLSGDLREQSSMCK